MLDIKSISRFYSGIEPKEVLDFYDTYYYDKDVNDVLKDVLIEALTRNNSNANRPDISVIEFDTDKILYIYKDYIIKGLVVGSNQNPNKTSIKLVHPINNVYLDLKMFRKLEDAYAKKFKHNEKYE